jgi:CO/xanthine dehydrogenase Mo-binding subunit
MKSMENTSIGQSLPRIDALGKVTGKTEYSGDVSLPGMLFMKLVFAERPHARILRMDISRAETAPGVVAVFTSKDVPVNEYGLQIPDQPVLCGPLPEAANSSGMVRPDIVRFIGDQVAAVVAETESQAAAAAKLIQGDYEDLPVLTDPVAAMGPEAPLLHPERGDTNICVHYRIRKGDVEQAFKSAAVIVEAEYRTPVQEHAYLQPEAGVAYLDEEGRVAVLCAGQWTHADRGSIAHALGLPDEKVRVIYPAIGGAFGGREDLSVQIVLGLAAMKLGRPVRIIWSRRESLIGHGKRHAVTLRARWGASQDGWWPSRTRSSATAGPTCTPPTRCWATRPSPPRARTSFPMSRRMCTECIPTTSRARPSAVSAHPRRSTWPNCRWASWPKSWAWTRWSSA